MKNIFFKVLILTIFLLNISIAGEITVTGFGRTREGAITSAFQEAVRQGIGTYIETSTMIRNDEIIRDEILEFAYGYVDKYTILSEYYDKKNGQYRIKICATVSNQNVQAVLGEVLPVTNLSDTDRKKLNANIENNISHQIALNQKAKRKAVLDAIATRICKKIFEEHREAFALVYEFVDSKLQVVSVNEDESTVKFKVGGKIRTNQQLYNLLLNSMISKIERVLRKKIGIDENGGKWYFEHKNAFARHYLVEENKISYHSHEICLKKGVRTRINPTLLIGFIDKDINVIYPIAKQVIEPEDNDSLVISPRFKLDNDTNSSLNQDVEVVCEVPIEIAKRISGVKGFLQDDFPIGEVLLDQLLLRVVK